jgi:hypothetical protein
VDLPEPDGPTTAVDRPAMNSTVTDSSAVTVAAPVPYHLLIPTARAAVAVAVPRKPVMRRSSAGRRPTHP